MTPIQMKPSISRILPRILNSLQISANSCAPDGKQHCRIYQNRIPTPKTLPWDINNDRVVDMKDLTLVSNNFGAKVPKTLET